MKKLIIIFLVCLSSIAKAQSSLCPALQAFNGEWRYVNGQDTIRIYLRYHECNFSLGQNDIRGRLFGWHEYKSGNTIIESNYASRFISLPSNYDNLSENSYSILLVMPECNVSRQRILGDIADLSQCRESKPVIITFNTAQNQLNWKQRDRDGFGFGTGCKGMTLPSSFLLTKQ